MKIMSVVGARPNFMKVAPIIAAIREHNASVNREYGSLRGNFERSSIHHVLVHTGQHYDPLMSGCFFADLDLPFPEIDLSVRSASHAVQTAEIMRGFERVLLREQPDILVVVGDVNSTLACALVASKISYGASGARPVIAHVEAGLRSFDHTMPEEINRLLTDQLADLLFVTEESAVHNLAAEGIPDEKVHFVGNTMIDSLLEWQEKAEASPILHDLGLRSIQVNGEVPGVALPYVLLTLHRPSNVDTEDSFLNILEGLHELGLERPVIFPAHPRTRSRITQFGLERYFASANDHPDVSRPNGLCNFRFIRMIEPLGYLDFLCLMKHATLVVTDSGGIQEETTCLGIPCVTVRENTERPVTVESGTNLVAGTSKERIAAAVRKQMGNNQRKNMPIKWDGHAARRIVDVLIKTHSAPESPTRLCVAQSYI